MMILSNSANRPFARVMFICLTCCIWSIGASAADYMLPPDDVDLVGEISYTTAKSNETLFDVARSHDLGADEIEAANPGVDPWIPKPGTKILLPTRHILPNVPREGIVVDSREMRLYYYPPAAPGKARRVVTHPVSVGRTDWGTPLGITKILAKIVDPVWIPPESIRKAAIQEGDPPLPAIVPAGPDNPLGKYAMRLALKGSYLIHGTDKRKEMGIGMQVTHGCMRLYTEDIATLFKQVAVDTRVNLIQEPIRLGWLADTLFIEVTPPPQAQEGESPVDLVQTTVELFGIAKDMLHAERAHRPFVLNDAALDILEQAVGDQTGVPVPVVTLSQ